MHAFGRLAGSIAFVAFALIPGGPAAAQVAPRSEEGLRALAFRDPRLRVDHATEPLADSLVASAGLRTAFEDLVERTGGRWSAQVDRRTGRLAYFEGSGMAWFPGDGNALRAGDVAPELAAAGGPDLAALDRRARAAAPEFAALLGFDPAALRLNAGRSGRPAPHVAFVDYDVLVGGLPVEGARVVFTVNNGNLVSVGQESLPSFGSLAPERRLDRQAALAVLADRIGGVYPDDEFLDAGTYRLVSATERSGGSAEGFTPGSGRTIVGVWELRFRRPGEAGTFRARVDASTGELLELADVNEYGTATGGAFAGDRPTPETVRPLPFANVAPGVYTNSAGIFAGTSGTTTLDGQYVKIVDSCGAISKSADGAGVIAMGTSTGTDCVTPGTGGAGNTHAARSQFYLLNRAKEAGRGWLPSNSWLSAKLTTNVNLNQTCNAYWDGASVNFFLSGGGCLNSAELPGISLHEYGHGLDSNDGNGSSNENGTGETYGDFIAAITTHTSCIGNGFQATQCGGYGNPCTSCSGIRDIDWAKHVDNTPSTVSNFTYFACPDHPTYFGPCGTEGHCESLVSSEALWDLAARDLPGPGTSRAWSVIDRLWFLSRSTATQAFQCNSSGFPWTSNGCFTGSYFRSLRAVDDDNGNLADGTPHGGAIGAAFARHNIACATDTGWNVTHAAIAPPAIPTLTATPADNAVNLAWSGSTGVYDVYRNEVGCNAGFTRIANDRATASYADPAVANGVPYYYQVISHPSGNEAAASAPSTCITVTPGASATVLSNGVAVTGLSGAAGNERRYSIAVPSGASNLVIQMSGGTGDADLHVRFGTPPTTTTYDCRPFVTGNNETCTVPTPSAGSYHVLIHAFTAYSGVSLVGSYQTGTIFVNGFASGNTSAWSATFP